MPAWIGGDGKRTCGGSLDETNRSLWIGTTGDADEYPTVTAPASFDVIVVGAGIAG